MARRWASTACVTSSKLTSENELPSGSLKRAKTPPQIGGCSAASDDEAAEPAVCTRTGYLSRLSRGLTKKRTPRALHSRNLASTRSEEHTSELQSRQYLVCRLLLEKKKTQTCPKHVA